MNIDQIIGNNIRKYRTSYNMTLKTLADKIHKSVSTLSKYEKGDISLDMPTFIELANILNVSPSVLLGGDKPLESKEYVQVSNSQQLYMYTYDHTNKSIVTSVIEQYPTTGLSNTYKAQLFNDVADIKIPGTCTGLYTGEYTKRGFIGTYILHNQISKSEDIMISCIDNLTNPHQSIGIVTGLSNYTMLPISFKTIISSIEVKKPESLIDYLLFSKEDFRSMKQNHYFTILNLK